MKDGIDLSICLISYNHEKYIRMAIESILMQKTTYRYEIIAVDDCSTDRTAAIIKEYAIKYSDKIKAVLLPYNTYKTVNDAFKRARDLACGKYVITIEGDDYWISPYKIQRQLDFLTSHPDYIAVAHNCIIVDGESKELREVYPECHDNEYTLAHWYKGFLPGQTATIMYVNPILNKSIDWSLKNKGLIPGDRLTAYILALNGKVYCIQEKMSAYRHVVMGGTSFSANNKYIYEKDERWYSEVVKYTYRYGNCEQIEKAEVLYLENIFRGIVKGHQATFKDVILDSYCKSGKGRLLLDFIFKQIKERIYK